jgi:hypothetical protein
VNVDDLLTLSHYHWTRDANWFHTERQRVQLALLVLLIAYTSARPSAFLEMARKESLEEAKPGSAKAFRLICAHPCPTVTLQELSRVRPYHYPFARCGHSEYSEKPLRNHIATYHDFFCHASRQNHDSFDAPLVAATDIPQFNAEYIRCALRR